MNFWPTQYFRSVPLPALMGTGVADNIPPLVTPISKVEEFTNCPDQDIQ